MGLGFQGFGSISTEPVVFNFGRGLHVLGSLAGVRVLKNALDHTEANVVQRISYDFIA